MEHARPPPELNMEGGPVSRADAWKRWKQQFVIFLKASGVKDEDKGVQASLLVNLIGADGYDVYQTFTFANEVERDDVNAIIKKFDSYFGTKVNLTLLRYKFFTRNQEDGEMITQYVTALRLLSKQCAFGQLEEELIKDRIVCGVNSVTVRDRLLRCDDLCLDKAVKICQAEEVSIESSRQLSGGASGSVVHIDGVERRGGGRRRGGVGAAAGRGARCKGPRPQPDAAPPVPRCNACGSTRCVSASQCPALYVVCYVCGKRGHYARVCKSNAINNNVRKVYEIGQDNRSDSSDECESFYVSVITGDRTGSEEQWYETLMCENGSEKFKLDTGADINVISYETFKRLGFDDNIMSRNKIRLESYSGNTIPVIGVCSLLLTHKNITYNMKFAIANMKCQSVLGRKSCEELGLIKRLHSINLTDYNDLFTGLGCLPGKYHIVIDNTIQPVVSATRKIPLGLRDQLAKELQKMEKLGVIRKVTYPTDWVHPLVLVAKKNNKIRVCLDPGELNRAVRRAHFQLPTVTELAARLHGARYFSVLDANSGFWAVQLDPVSADLCTFATPFGRYQFLRLPFGINCASEVFHGKMRQLLEGLEGTDSFIDDIIVWGKTKQEHDQRLHALLKRAREINLKFNREKCKIGVEQVTYLGHIFDANGMKPDNNKVKAILDMPAPTDRKSLERFLGAVNYLAKFIPNYSQIAIPLTNLLKKDIEWRWDSSEQGAFEQLKQCVSRAPVLALYDVSRGVTLSVDASRDALGAVLLQDGRPVEYASRTLTPAQRRYAQVEKELLAIVFALIITVCWVAGAVVGLLPLFGWHADVGAAPGCYFVEVMDYNYLLFLYFATIVTPSVLLAAFYAHIYRVVVKQMSEVMTVEGWQGSRGGKVSSGTMLRVLGAAQKREVKATQNLAIIVFFFIICWIPLYTINAIKAFMPELDIPNPLTYVCIIVSHLNSAINPLLYAYHLKDFRAALKGLICAVFGRGVPIPAAYRPPLPIRRLDLERSNAIRTRPKIYVNSPVWLRQKEAEGVATIEEKTNVVVVATAPVTPDVEPFLQRVGADGSSGRHTPEGKESDAPYLIHSNSERCQSPYKKVEELIRRVRSVSGEHS